MAGLTDLALRSKAHWGYDAAFMAACVAELTITPDMLDRDLFALAVEGGRVAGFCRVSIGESHAELEDLFVEPDLIGTGLGRALWTEAVRLARAAGATRIELDADPNAAAFYTAMGAAVIGQSPSGSIPGRVLPRMR
ncbi:MAG: GNAT family N-acetyltransferase [Pseudomonadota bacterium]|nr:GNAT family N-acetyltransferase [Pseudomonadota bacterium]